MLFVEFDFSVELPSLLFLQLLSAFDAEETKGAGRMLCGTCFVLLLESEFLLVAMIGDIRWSPLSLGCNSGEVVSGKDY